HTQRLARAASAHAVATAGRKRPPLHRPPRRVAEPAPRAVLTPLPAHMLAERPPDPRARRRELRLEPAVEDAREEPPCDVVRRHLELRVDLRLDRPLAQQLGTEGVDGADASRLELRQRLLKA